MPRQTSRTQLKEYNRLRGKSEQNKTDHENPCWNGKKLKHDFNQPDILGTKKIVRCKCSLIGNDKDYRKYITKNGKRFRIQ
jgi:hypothetical protein